MLTKSDLAQITKIVQTETTKVVQTESKKVVRSEILSFEKRMDKRFDKLERKLDYAINFLEREYLRLLERIERIEEHLNLRPTLN